MYALVNFVFGFVLGEIKHDCTVGGTAKRYSTIEDLATAYYKLSATQRVVIIPALLEGEEGSLQYTTIEFVKENT